MEITLLEHATAMTAWLRIIGLTNSTWYTIDAIGASRWILTHVLAQRTGTVIAFEHEVMNSIRTLEIH